MTVETVGNPPPNAEQFRAEVEKQLPDIIASFNQVLQTEYGLKEVRGGGFTLVPSVTTASGLSCDEESCSIDGRR